MTSVVEADSPVIFRPELRALDTIIAGAQALRAQLAGAGPLADAVNAAVELIAGNKGRLLVTGVGKSGHIARKLAATFSSTGTPAYYIHPTEASHGDLGMIDDSDVIFALSWSGETAELASILAYAKRFAVSMIALTAGGRSTLATAADVALILPRAREACPHNLAPTTSTVMQLALGDAIAIAVMTRKGFTARDFSVFHPGGKLGAKLRRVGELMHAGNLPVLPLGSRMGDAILTMTSGGFGVVGITEPGGDLIGLITDGDLRRFLRNDAGQQADARILDVPVDKVMTRSPVVVAPEAFAAEALEILQSRKISVLFVVDGRRPVGVIHMHDLLRVGVA